MRLAQMLEDDHREVNRALGSLRAVARRIESGQGVDPRVIDDILLFLKEFVDHCHHAKEERIIFPAVERIGSETDRDLVKKLVAEHEIGRELVLAMSKASDAYDRGDLTAAEGLIRAITDYDSLLVRHIQVENTALIDILKKSFPDREAEELFERCEEIEEEIPLGHHGLLDLIEKIEGEVTTAGER